MTVERFGLKRYISHDIDYEKRADVYSSTMELDVEKFQDAVAERLVRDYQKMFAVAVIKCKWCGSWGARFCACKHCGAPIE